MIYSKRDLFYIRLCQADSSTLNSPADLKKMTCLHDPSNFWIVPHSWIHSSSVALDKSASSSPDFLLHYLNLPLPPPPSRRYSNRMHSLIRDNVTFCVLAVSWATFKSEADWEQLWIERSIKWGAPSRSSASVSHYNSLSSTGKWEN